ncbi:Crp/Fnr family transcriptional regulator [Lysinibacillus pakistanensis]|uniref:Crp/Fnr family transcriptional regulator n=1 Tax=Lysinibacillus pakistanensis TaxID=759811 RepID=UPI003D2A25BB
MQFETFTQIYGYTFQREFKKNIEIRRYDSNDYILKVGEAIMGLYFLLEGKYYVSSPEITGKELLLRYCQKPAIMGDVEIFQNCLVQSNCIAAETCQLLFVPYALYEQHLKYDSAFTQLLLQELAYKLRTCTISSRVNALSSVSTRLAAYLCTIESTSLFKEYIKTNTLDEVASLIGTTKRHLNRVLKQWSDAGIIQRKEEMIKIINWSKIEEISENVRFE